MGLVSYTLISLVDFLWSFIKVLNIQLTWTHYTARAVWIIRFYSQVWSFWAFLRSYIVAWDPLNITLPIICYILLHELVIVDCNQITTGATHVSLVLVLVRAQKHVISALGCGAAGVVFWFTRVVSLLTAGIVVVYAWELLWKVFIIAADLV